MILKNKINYCILFLIFIMMKKSDAQYVTLQGHQFKDQSGVNFYPMIFQL
jgi:hypothetical protein